MVDVLNKIFLNMSRLDIELLDIQPLGIPPTYVQRVLFISSEEFVIIINNHMQNTS